MRISYEMSACLLPKPLRRLSRTPTSGNTVTPCHSPRSVHRHVRLSKTEGDCSHVQTEECSQPCDLPNPMPPLPDCDVQTSLDIPTLGQWSLMGLAILLLTGGKIKIHRRRSGGIGLRRLSRTPTSGNTVTPCHSPRSVHRHVRLSKTEGDCSHVQTEECSQPCDLPNPMPPLPDCDVQTSLDIPTLGQWSLMGLAILLLTGGMIKIHRRRSGQDQVQPGPGASRH